MGREPNPPRASFARLDAVKDGEREGSYTNSETCPSGRSNSNVFSVIDTIV